MEISNEYTGFSLERLRRFAVLTFSRPEIRNPLSVNVIESLVTALDELESDKNIETLVITGSGKTFASGADLNEVSKLDSKSAYEFGKRGQDLMRRIAGTRLKTFAAINGFCFGGALDLALSCDYRIASEESVFAHPGASLGIITGWGGTQMLPKLVGYKNACDMFLNAKKLDAAEALRISLIDEIVEDPLARAIEMMGDER